MILVSINPYISAWYNSGEQGATGHVIYHGADRDDVWLKIFNPSLGMTALNLKPYNLWLVSPTQWKSLKVKINKAHQSTPKHTKAQLFSKILFNKLTKRNGFCWSLQTLFSQVSMFCHGENHHSGQLPSAYTC